MKKLLVLVLLVPILALTMISCDGQMRADIADLMGGFGGNVYEDAGLIVINTAQADAAATTVAEIGNAAGSEDVTAGGSSTSLGVSITVPAGVTKIMAPQTEAEQDELKDNLADAFNSDTQKEQLLEDLKKPASLEQQEAAKGTIAVFNATLEAFKAELNDGSSGSDFDGILVKLELPGIGNGSSLTQGDLLNLQLMTNLISNTIGNLTSIGNTASVSGDLGLDGVGDADFESEENMKLIFKVIDDILFASETAGNISSSTNFNFMGDINLGELMDSFVNEV